MTNSIKISLFLMLSMGTNVILFLGRPWQHDADATHKDKGIHVYVWVCVCVFTWKSKRVAMKPIPPIPTSIQEKASSLVSLCNPFDQNSRESYFEEWGTDVRRQSQNTRLNKRSNTSLDWLASRLIKSTEDVSRSPDRPTDNKAGNKEETKSPSRPQSWPSRRQTKK